MKTIEILLVIVVTSFFLLNLLQSQFSSNTNERSEYLIELEQDQEFRNYVSENSGCFNSSTSSSGYIRKYLPTRFDYTLCINAKPEEFVAKQIYVNSLFFSGNITTVQTKTIKLYYWLP